MYRPIALCQYLDFELVELPGAEAAEPMFAADLYGPWVSGLFYTVAWLPGTTLIPNKFNAVYSNMPLPDVIIG